MKLKKVVRRLLEIFTVIDYLRSEICKNLENKFFHIEDKIKVDDYNASKCK